MFPKGNNVDNLSMYLDVADSAHLPYGWSKCAQFSIAVVNQFHDQLTIRKGMHFHNRLFFSFILVFKSYEILLGSK